MTPLAYEAYYHNLPIFLENLRMTTVNVRRYQNNKEKLRENVNLGNKEALYHKDLLIGRMASEVKKLRDKQKTEAKGKEYTGKPIVSEGDVGLALVGSLNHLTIPEILKRWRDRMMAVHSGKGSPLEIQVCLHLVAIYGLYDTKRFTDSAEGVKDYCDKYIGLDCNGFVGNFARDTGTGKEPNTPIYSYAPKGRRRTKLEDVQRNDVLAWTDDGHIAIIDSISPMFTGPTGKPTRDAVVVESTAGNTSTGTATAHGGLQHSTYCLRAIGPDQICKVERPKGKGTASVYIAPVG